MTNQVDYLFFLGGHDLEMLEIKILLDKYKNNPNSFFIIDYIDNNLQWGAKLSNYRKNILEIKTLKLVGIELIEDIPLPANYISIDHHNEKSVLPSSIEQLATLLGIELDRWQQLVAANDRGYFPAMLAMGASNEEVTRIREADRRAQGVTDKDEQLAEYHVDKFFKFINDIGVVETSLKKFSPITDRIRIPKLIVYNEENVNYYGKGAEKLGKITFFEEVQSKSAYYGGGADGFFGIIKLHARYIDTLEIVKQIIDAMSEPIVISTHCFMFPFKWEVKKNKDSALEDVGFNQRVNLEAFEFEIEKSGWVRDFLDDSDITRSPLHYNEYTYYHDFVRKIIFDTRDQSTGNDVMRHYRFNGLTELAFFEFSVVPFETKKYNLSLKGLHLHIYKTGVGVLSFDFENFDQTTSKKDILIINEYGRRIYPQFTSDGFDLTAVKTAFLPDTVKYSYDGMVIREERFESFSGEQFKKNMRYSESFIPPKYIMDLFDRVHFGYHNSKGQSGLFIEHITDDRMFVVSWYGNNEIAQELGNQKQDQYGYENSNWWYCYLFGDKETPSISHNRMMVTQIKEHTYCRWAGYGTLFGITRDTFVCVSSDIPTLARFNAPPIKDHMITIYYQMVLLGLVQRASVLNFSGEVSDLSHEAYDLDTESMQEKVKQLYRSYIEFINKVYYREVTSQIQGIELYQLMQRVMNIEKEVTDLDNEITELHQYVSLLQDKERNKQSMLLNLLAVWFLPASFITSILGIGFISDRSSIKWFGQPTAEVGKSLLLIGCGGIISIFITIILLKREKFSSIFRKLRSKVNE